MTTAKKFQTLLERLRQDEPHMSDVIEMCGTREEAATVAGVTRRTVHNWIAGRSSPSFAQGVALCRAAKVDPLTVYDADREELTLRPTSPQPQHRDDHPPKPRQ